MSRNLKALCLALFAAFAMSAVAASSASAVKEFHSDIEPTVLTGTDTPEKDSEFESGAGVTKCSTTLYESTVNTKSAQEITVTPTYSGCTTSGVTTHVRMNGCAYIFTLEEGQFDTRTHQEVTEGKPEKLHTRGPVHVECPLNTKIEIEVTVPFFHDCILKIGAQTPTKPSVDYTNQGEGTTTDVEAVSTNEGIAYTVTTGSEGICGKTAHDGKYRGTVTIKGFTDAAEAGKPFKHNNVQHAVWIA